MMAIVVEDGTGLVNADSYVSVADADAYLSVLPSDATTLWDALSATEKENALKWATRVLNNKASFEGYKTVETSALRWPRTSVCDVDGVEVDSTSIPRQITSATIELVRILLEEDITTGQDISSLKRIMVDVIEIEFQDETTQGRIPSYLNATLGGLGWVTSGPRQAVGIIRT